MPTENRALPRWRRTLDSLRETQTELVRLCPFRDHGLSPHPSASVEELADLQRRLGLTLPPAYREFLAYSNGWSRLFDGADLLGTAQLGAGEPRRVARALLDRTLPAGLRDDRVILPFGMDALGTTLFAFDYTRGGREPSIIAWVSELALSAASFPDFLGLLLTLAERDLAEERERVRASSRVLQRGAVESSAA